ncbi:hypothetical protein QQ045_007399 [Rhodiola kirilowii]
MFPKWGVYAAKVSLFLSKIPSLSIVELKHKIDRSSKFHIQLVGEMAAEVGAGVAIAGAVCKLSKFVSEQADSLLYIRDKFECLEKELSSMRSFLEDAEKKLDNSSSNREWVSNVRDLAYDCEDVIDTFLVKQKTQPGCIPYTAKFLSNYDLGRKIEKLLGKANKISESRKRYGLDAYVSTTSEK